MSVVAGRTSRSFRYTLSLPHEVTDMQQWIRYCRSRSNIIVHLLEEAKSQAQPNVAVENARVVRFLGGLARLLHETKLLLFNN